MLKLLPIYTTKGLQTNIAMNMIWCHINNIKIYLDTNLLYVLKIEISICKGYFIVCFKNRNISL